MAIDASGLVHVAGQTSSPDLPKAGGPRHYFGNSDAFVARLSSAEISISSATVPEGNGPHVILLTATLSQPLPTPLTLTYRTEEGTASGFTDYDPARRTFAIPAGTTTGQVPVGSLGDYVHEADESFSIVISPDGPRVRSTRGPPSR
jgi:chitinase